MKRLFSALLVVGIILSFSGCSEKITLDNIDKLKTDTKYSKVIMSSFVKSCDDNKIISDANNFANKFLSSKYTLSYTSDNGADKEKLLYSDNYKEKHKDWEENLKLTGEIYNTYKISTELKGITVKRIIQLGDDTLVEGNAKIWLTECVNNDVIRILGYNDGLNTCLPLEFSLKIKYINNENYTYDYVNLSPEGGFKDFVNLKDKLNKVGPITIAETEVEAETKLPEEVPEEKPALNKINREDAINLVKKVSALQNNRNYNTMKGNEDYPYLSSNYKAKLGENDIKNTVDTYKKLELTTEFISCDVTSVSETANGFVINTVTTIKIVSCVSDEVARKLGASGIGGTRTVKCKFLVSAEDGNLKIFDQEDIK